MTIWFLIAAGALAACSGVTGNGTPSSVSNTPRITLPAPTSSPETTPTAVPPTATLQPLQTVEDVGEAPEVERGGNADVISVRAVEADDDTWTFHVTVRHPDTGWEDYADGWDVVTPDGQVIKVDPADQYTRLLLHPHVNEQPFTRSQSGLSIPSGVTEVIVRAHDLVDGYGGQVVVVDLTVDEGDGFTVEAQR